MLTRPLSYYSDGIGIHGILQLPSEPTSTRKHPVIILCSGFQGLKEIMPAKLWGPFTDAGYACFAFDYRGVGTSGGERGRLIPREQVEDVLNTVTFLRQLPELDTERVGAIGWGFGGGVVVQAAAEDDRIRAVACLNGVGDGGRAVRASRPETEWADFQRRIAEDRIRRVLTGRSELVSPWEVVPLDPVTRKVVDEDMYGNHPRFANSKVSLQSAEAYYAFRPELVAHLISPRPLLIVHAMLNELHPIAEARSLYARAHHPKTLIEIPSSHHLDWIQPDHPLYLPTVSRIIDWFRCNLPVDACILPER